MSNLPTKEFIEGAMDMIDDDAPDGAFWQMVVDSCRFTYPDVTLDQILEILGPDEGEEDDEDDV
jgi:hypothetical protein